LRFLRLPFRFLGGFAFGLLSRFLSRFLFPLTTNFRLAPRFCFPLGLRQPGLSFHLLALPATFFLRLPLQFSPDCRLVHNLGGNRFDFILHGMQRARDIED
jgi:hypothetical protein